jgi:three-Cys-motif partner protein
VQTPPSPPIDDGLVIRDAGSWTKIKLEIVERYVSAFGTACSGKARSWYCVDAFAGPGINRIRDTDELVWGTPILALEAVPSFDKCLLMDNGDATIEALQARTLRFGDRAVIRQGDCNTELIPAMQEVITPKAPCLCVFDPEGPHLEHQTVEAVARFRRGQYRVEQLILLPTHTGFLRELFLERDLPAWAERDLRRVYGNDDWRAIHQQRREGWITASEATTNYVRLYGSGLERLGYRTVLDKEIRTQGDRGRLLYFLIFATDHPAGERIMNHIFDSVGGGDQQQLFRTPRPRRLP